MAENKNRLRKSTQARRGRAGEFGRQSALTVDGRGKSFAGRRLVLLIVALFVLFGLFVAFGGPYLLTNRYVASALHRYDYRSAEYWFSINEIWQPWLGSNANAELLASRLARRRGQIQEMEACLKSASNAGAPKESVERERVLAQVQSGEVDLHEVTITTWLTNSDADSAEICDAYANGLAVVSRLDDALSVLEAWHRDDPAHPVPLYRMGKIYEYYDNTDAAIEAYRKSLSCDEDYLPAAFRLGTLYLAAKKPADAELLFRRCEGLVNPLASRVGVAVCQAELGNTEEAKQILREVLQHAPENINESYAQLNESPETFLAAVELGKLEVNSGEYAEGIDWLDRALEFNPRDLAARYSRAVALRQSGQIDRAESEFQLIEETKRALEQVNVLRNQIGREPTTAQPRIELGRLLLKYESERNGLFWLRSALTVEPNNAEVHQILAEHYRSKSVKSPQFESLADHHQKWFETLQQGKSN